MTPSDAAVPRRVLIDGTLTLRSNTTTGVPRLVRSIIEHGTQFGIEGRCPPVSAVMLARGGLEECPAGTALPEPGVRDDIARYLPESYRRAAGWLCSKTKSRRLSGGLLPKPGHLGLFRLPVRMMERAQRLAGRLPRSGSQLGLGPGDLLILPDGYWGKMEIWDYVRAARAAGAYTAIVIYDLIPLTHPQFLPRRTPEHFKRYLREAVSNSDLLMAISRTVRDELLEKLPQLFPDLKVPEINYFHLGADFVAAEGPVREEIQQLFGPQQRATPYISVSTFDPRKNQAFTLDAFEQLWQQGNDARLVYIGGRGWMSDGLLQRLAEHPQRDKKLFVFHDLTDRELGYCYQQARGTIMASFVEGFGLPIIESLWHRRRTFASDTPIHREVGGAHAEYFSLNSPAALVERIERWEAAIYAGEPVQRPAVKPMDWRESTETLFSRCLEAYAARQTSAAGASVRKPHIAPQGSLTKVA